MKTALKTKIVIVFLALLTFCGAMFLFAFNAKTTFAEPVVKDYWSWSSSTQIDQKTTTLPDATVGESYSVSISGPFDGDMFPVYSATIKNSQNQEVTDFGTGLLIDTIDAYSISGTPTVAGTYTIFVDNSLGGVEAYSFTINPAGFTISFDTDGGTSIEDLTGQTTLPTPFPSTSKTGYTFVGWYLDDEFKNAAVCNTPITANTTLYAKYTEDIEIDTSVQRYVFDGNQHTAQLKDKSGNPITLDGFTYTIKRQYATGTEAVEVSDCIEPAQYLFFFYRDADDTYSQVNGTFIYVIVTYSVTYKVNGGDGEDFVDICENPNYDFYYYGNDDYNGGKKLEPSFTTFTKEHYVFYGWNDKADGTGNQYKSATSYDITSNMTLYAIYTPVLVQPNSSNNYTVGVTTTDSVEYQWYKRTTVYTPFTDSSKLEYGSLNAETGVVSSSSNRVRFSFRGEIIFKSDATLTGLSSTDGVYYARSYRFAFIDVSSSSNFTIYDVKVISYVDAILPTETSSSLSCGTENASYYCNVRSLKYNTTISSDSIAPTTISFVGGEGTTGTKPSDLYQLQKRTISLPNNPFTKTGVSFIGWNDGTTTYKEGFIYTVGSTKVTFTAKFGHTCNGCDFDIPLDSTFEGGDIGSGHYYLTSDITITTDITTDPKSEVVICLNGHILDLNGHQLYCYDGYLELYDCNDDETNVHNYKVNANGVWVLTTNIATKTLSSLNSTPKENDVIEIKGGAIVGGVGQYYGGAVYCGKHLIAKNVSFIGNHSTDEAGKKGGAIDANKATIINCQFYGNRSIEGSSIYGAKVNIYYSTFKFNSTYQVEVEQEPYGGSGTIFNNGTLLLEHSTIQYNQGFKGSAIFLDRDYNPIATIIDSTITDNLATEKGGAITIDNPGCFKEGTLITMGDGSEKAIEELKVGDLVKSFNHETGLYESNPIYYIYTNYEYAECIKLTFESGNTLTLVDCHDLFNQEANKYVTINSANAESYLNKYFYNSSLNSGNGGWDQLISVSCTGEYVTYYSIYVGYTANCLANGLLTCPDDTDARLNIYKFGADLVADATQLQSDIDTYGLKEFNDCTLIKTEAAYEMFGIKYYNLYIGKGLMTERELNNAFYEVCDGSEYTTGVSGNSIIIGQNTTIQNNKVNDTENNLDLSADNQIVVLEDAKNINVGITLQSTLGTFAQKVYANNIGFTSDNPVYGVKCKQTGTTYSYSITVLKEEPSKSNDYTVVLDDSIKDNYKYQWYEGFGVKEFSNLNSSEYSFEYSNVVSGNTIDSNYVEDFIESTSGHVVNFYFSDSVECFIYFDCSIGSIVANDKYTSFVYYEGNSYVAYCDDGEFSCFSTSEEFSLENVRVQIVTTLTSETKAKIGTTTLSDASYFCHIYDNTDKLVESSISISPKTISLNKNEATSGTDSTIYQFEGRKVTIPTTGYTRTGYKYLGWNTTSTATTALTFTNNQYTVGSSDETFYVTWQEKKTITINETKQYFNVETTTSDIAFVITGTNIPTSGLKVSYRKLGTASFDENLFSTKQASTYYDVHITYDEDDTYKALDLTITKGLGIYFSIIYHNTDATSGSVPVDSTKYIFTDFTGSKVVTSKTNENLLARTGYTFGGWYYCNTNETLLINIKPTAENDYIHISSQFSNVHVYPNWILKTNDISKTNDYKVTSDADLSDCTYQWSVESVYKLSNMTKGTMDELEDGTKDYYIGRYDIEPTSLEDIVSEVELYFNIKYYTPGCYLKYKTINGYISYDFMDGEYYCRNSSPDNVFTNYFTVIIDNLEGIEDSITELEIVYNKQIEGETKAKVGSVIKGQSAYCVVSYSQTVQGIEIQKTLKTNSVSVRTVVFDGNGATSGNAVTLYNLDGRALTLPSNPFTRTAYKYVGWNANKDATAKLDSYTVGSTDATLYAIWKEKATVSITQTAQTYLFGLENVRFEITGTTLTGFDVKYKRSTSVTTQTPTGIGYYDVVIHRDECADYKEFDLTITNGFGRYCTVTYLKGDEASGTAPEDSNKYFNYEFEYTILDNTTIQRTGYNFVGWKEQSDTNGIIYKPGFEYTVGVKNYTYVPVWELKLKDITKDNNYTVSFDATDLITQSYQWLKFVSIPLDEIPTSVYSFYDEGPYGIIGTKKTNNTITSHYENGFMAQAIFMIIDKNAVNQYTTLSFKSQENTLWNVYALEGYESISKDASGVFTITLSQTYITEGCYYVYISNSQDSETTFDVTDFHFNNMSVAIENETQSKLQNVSELTGYYCGVTYKTMENGIEVTKTSYTNVVTPKTISFNANGATSGTTPSTVYELEGRKVTLPQLTLTKDGYTFGGWVVETTSYNPGIELLVPSNDIEVCANWEQNKQVVGDKTEPDVKPTVEVSLKDNDNGIPTTITVVVEVTVEVEVETKELTVNYYKLDESNAKLSDDEKVGVVFDVKLIQTIDGVSREIQPSDIKEGTTIKVKMLIPDTVDITKVTRILHVHSASDIEVIDFDPSKVDENGYYEIEVDRLSEFAFIYVKDCKIHYILIATLTLLILFVLILWFACEIRSFREKSIKSLIPGIGFTIHLIIMTVIRIFMGECKICAIIHLVNLVALALFVLLYIFYKPHKGTPTTLKEAMSLASEIVQSNSLVNKKSVADFLDEQFKENVLTNRRENYIKSGILPLADTHYKVTSEKKTCFIYVYELRNGNTFFLVKCNPKLAKQIKKKHSSFNASAFPKTKNHDWYTMIVDESYENTEEVFDVLKQIFDEQ